MVFGSERTSFADLPDELVVQVFSSLNPAQLNSCSRVCKRWSRLFQEPALWRCVYATMWSQGQWNHTADYVGYADQIPEYNFYLEVSKQSRPFSLSVDPVCLTVEPFWHSFYFGLEGFLMDHVGSGVRVLELSANNFLNDSQFNALISACPNLEELYANYTCISSEAFDVWNPGSCLKKLRKLALSGCNRITDQTIKNLVSCWNAGSDRATGLRSLSLSGSCRLTDGALETLSTCTTVLVDLEFLDLSGCSFSSGELLETFVHGCKRLEPKNLFYCCNIVKGPYQASANGCNNLDNVDRACCVHYRN